MYEKDRKKGAGALITPAKTYNSAADLVLGQSTEETPKKLEVASKKRKHHEAETEPLAEHAKETIQEDGDQEDRKKKKSNEGDESPVADADGDKKRKKKSKGSEEPPVATAEGEKKNKKKKYDVQDGEDLVMESEDSSKKDKKKNKKKHIDE